jgi:glycosyltransferase involved in cell wall biosynthesis
MEAMASGLPIVATTTGGIPYLVHDGVNGILVPPAVPASIVDAVARLTGDEAMSTAMGERNREQSRERDWSVIAQRVADVYRDAGAEVD